MELAAEMAESIVHKVDLLMVSLQDDKHFGREIGALNDAIESVRAELVHSRVSAAIHVDAASLEKATKVRAALYDIDHFVDAATSGCSSSSSSRSLLDLPVKRILDSFLNYQLSAWKIRGMKKAFEGRVNNNNSVSVSVTSSSSDLNPRRDHEETQPSLSAPSLVGRKSERNAINRLLIGDDSFSAVLIHGKEGLGKTTVAQLVCLRSPVFDLCFWVWVGKELDSSSLISKVEDSVSAQIQNPPLETATPTKKLASLSSLFSFSFTEQIQAGAGQSSRSLSAEQIPAAVQEDEDPIREKKVLLVLDDVRHLDEATLVRIRDSPMFAGSSTIKVVITTRSTDLATASYGNIQTAEYGLRAISDEDAFTLFQKVAFTDDHQDKELLDLCWEMMKRSNNMPRTIMELAPLVKGEQKSKWKAMMNADFSWLREAYAPSTSASELSFRLLPSPLKRCFAYSAFLFQQNENIAMHQLIHLWIAQGYIQESALEHENKTLEEVSEEYYRVLQDWCFFKDHKSDFDLAKSVAESEMLGINVKCDKAGSVLGNNIEDIIEPSDCRGIYHLFISNTSTSSMATVASSVPPPPPCSLLKDLISAFSPQLRSFLKAQGSTIVVTRSICDQLFSSMRYLRALDLNSSKLSVVPASIALLEHLRYLNLSINDFKKLPDSITTLAKLQVLHLSFCKKLEKLPMHFSRLSSLRHLYLDGCKRLKGMPAGLRKMTALQTLNLFVLGITRKCCTLDELSSLNLKSELTYRFASLL